MRQPRPFSFCSPLSPLRGGGGGGRVTQIDSQEAPEQKATSTRMTALPKTSFNSEWVCLKGVLLSVDLVRVCVCVSVCVCASVSVLACVHVYMSKSKSIGVYAHSHDDHLHSSSTQSRCNFCYSSYACSNKRFVLRNSKKQKRFIYSSAA